MKRAAAVLLTSVVALTVAAPGLATPALADDTADHDIAFIKHIIAVDARAEVQAAAWAVLYSEKPNAAAEFLTPGGGWDDARARAARTIANNNAIIQHWINVTTPETSPIVHLTASLAANGTIPAKALYVASGLQEAKDLDAKHSPLEAVRQQAQQDRDYVADLAAHAGGAWVRAAAARALDKGTDADIQLFFKYTWASAADCDIQDYRLDVNQLQVEYRSRLNTLLALAQQAQQAYENASDAAKAKAAAEAKSAWNTAADVAAATQQTWQSNQQLAASQAQFWQSVHDFALQATTDQDWPGIADHAAGTSGSWDDELTWAQEQAEQWSDLADSARQNAEALPDAES